MSTQLRVLYNVNIFINRRSAHATHSRKFRNVEHAVLVRWVVTIEDLRYIVLRERRSAQSNALRFGVRYSKFKNIGHITNEKKRL